MAAMIAAMTAGKGLLVRAPAKINLSLRITGRRPDGYHTLVSHMQKVGLYDELYLELGGENIELRCPDGKSPIGRDNLVVRAAELFWEHVGTTGQSGRPFGLRMELKKGIPVAAGLGGGSSDAAATLLGLNMLAQTQLSKQILAGLGLRLGADVPFFVHEAPAALAQGIGEELLPAEPLAGYAIVLVNPGIAVSTQWVYQNFDLTSIDSKDNLLSFQDGFAGGDESLACFNDLEQVTIRRYPLVGELKEEMLHHGAVATLMSGSGPTVFGLFAHEAQAVQAVQFFQRRFEDSYLVEPLQG